MTLAKTVTQVTRQTAAIVSQCWRQHKVVILLAYSTAGLLCVLLYSGVFVSLPQRINDFQFTVMPTSNTIVLVALDDASFQAYGRSPVQWPRSLYAQLVERVAAAGARVLSFDLLFAEPSPDDEAFAEAIRAARNSDARLRVVLATAGSGTPLPLFVPHHYYLAYPFALMPVEPLRSEAAYLGFVNAFPDSDGLLRRQMSVVQADEEKYLSFSIASYLAYLRVPSSAWQQVVHLQGNVLNVTPERQLVVDSNGIWRQNFFGQPNNNTFPAYSFKDVLEGAVAPEAFKDKLVLVGIFNSTGITDQFLVPISISGHPMTGLEIQANAIETLIQGKALEERPPSDNAIFILLAATLVLFVRLLSKWWQRLVAVLLLLVAWFVFLSWQFVAYQRVHQPVYPIVALVVPTLGLAWYESAMIRRQRNLLAAETSQLAALNKLKTHMIRMASHDLKNPLSRIIGYVELVSMDGNLSPDQTRFLGHIRESANEMYHIITDILTLEQVRGAQSPKEPVLLPRVVMQVLTSQEPDMYRKSQNLVDEIGNEPIYVMGSLHQLSQAAANLISNAVKYTPEGGTITVRVYKDARYAYLQVEDTGYGIPQSALPKLFTDFYRVKTKATAAIAGTGLGLSLVKTVVEAHNGVVTVQSEEGKGSVFTVQLPLIPAPET